MQSVLEAVAVDGVLGLPLDGPLAAVAERLRAVATDAGVRVVVLRSDGADPGPAPDGASSAAIAGLLRHLPQPVVASVRGACGQEAVTVLQACDIVFTADDTRFAVAGSSADGREAERTGLVTLAFPAADLERETAALARDLSAKDPLALRFTKETLRDVGDVAWDAVLDYNAAKVAGLKVLQAGQPSTRAAGVASFLAGKSKPGLGA